MKNKFDKKKNKNINLGIDGIFIIIRNKKNNIFLIVIFVVLINFLVVSIGKTIDNKKLAKQGVETIGVISDVREVGSKGIIRCTYEFKVHNNTYIGSVDDDDLGNGDTIRIIYLEDNPKKNRARKFINQIMD